jgi:hypothetical protein
VLSTWGEDVIGAPHKTKGPESKLCKNKVLPETNFVASWRAASTVELFESLQLTAHENVLGLDDGRIGGMRQVLDSVCKPSFFFWDFVAGLWLTKRALVLWSLVVIGASCDASRS